MWVLNTFFGHEWDWYFVMSYRPPDSFIVALGRRDKSLWIFCTLECFQYVPLAVWECRAGVGFDHLLFPFTP